MKTAIALCLSILTSTCFSTPRELLKVLPSRRSVEALFARATAPSVEFFEERNTAWVGSCSHFPNIPDGNDRPLRESSGMLRTWPVTAAPHFNMRNESRDGGEYDVASDPARYLDQGADFTYGVRGLMADNNYLNTEENLSEITPAGRVSSDRRSIEVSSFYEMLQWTYQGGLQIREVFSSGERALIVREDFHAVPIRFRLGGGWVHPEEHVNEPLGPNVSRYCVLTDDILTPGAPGADGPILGGAFLH